MNGGSTGAALSRSLLPFWSGGSGRTLVREQAKNARANVSKTLAPKPAKNLARSRASGSNDWPAGSPLPSWGDPAVGPTRELLARGCVLITSGRETYAPRSDRQRWRWDQLVAGIRDVDNIQVLAHFDCSGSCSSPQRGGEDAFVPCGGLLRKCALRRNHVWVLRRDLVSVGRSGCRQRSCRRARLLTRSARRGVHLLKQMDLFGYELALDGSWRASLEVSI